MAEANNGNWQTASRWRELLAGDHAVRIVGRWPDDAASGDQLMLALHARRSAPSIATWAEARGSQGLAVVLTGTDLYQDIAFDTQAQQSLRLAHRLVVLQEDGLAALPPDVRERGRVIYQSTDARPPLAKPSTHLQVVMVGHLRAVKSPQTLFEAARRLPPDAGIRIEHIGGAGEAHWADEAYATEAACPHYRWLGPQPHERTREAIQHAHLLVHTSALEGGAHVIMEAVCSGTPVLASRVSGNVGLLGADYAGYFEHGDADALAGLLLRCRREQVASAAPPGENPTGGLLERLRRQCAIRAPLFDPARERAALLSLIDELLHP